MKAQISLEFIFYASVLIIIVVIATYFSISTGNDFITESINVNAKRLAGSIANEINVAVEVGDGYSHRFTLPLMLYGEKDYSINFTAQRVYISWEGRIYSIPVLSHNITGTVSKGNNIIRNSAGVIVFG